jgi:hypothetical protein
MQHARSKIETLMALSHNITRIFIVRWCGVDFVQVHFSCHCCEGEGCYGGGLEMSSGKEKCLFEDQSCSED